MLHDTPVLVEVRRGEHRAGVRMDAEGDLWIAHWREAAPERVAGTRLDGPGPAQIRGPGWAAVGGRLPAGAAVAEVRDEHGAWCRAATGHGAWAVFVARDAEASGLPPVRFADEHGAPVRAVAAARLDSATPLTPSQAALVAACPACGASDWRGEAAAPPAQGVRILCAACSHHDGGVRAFYGVDSRA